MENSLPTGAKTTTYTYDLVGNIVTVAEPNGVVTTYTYNSVNDITGETVTPYYTYALHSNRVSETTIRSKERPTKANNGGQK